MLSCTKSAPMSTWRVTTWYIYLSGKIAPFFYQKWGVQILRCRIHISVNWKSFTNAYLDVSIFQVVVSSLRCWKEMPHLKRRILHQGLRHHRTLSSTYLRKPSSLLIKQWGKGKMLSVSIILRCNIINLWLRLLSYYYVQTAVCTCSDSLED